MSVIATDLANLRPEQKRALLEQLLQERNARQKRAPLSSAQKRLWFLDKLEPNSATYNVPAVLRLEGRLDAERLRRSLEIIVERHEALRTSFDAAEDTPFQNVRPASRFELPLIDLSGSSASSIETVAAGTIAREVRRPFNLAADLMLRAILVRLAAEKHVLVLTLHHIASDEWSLRVLLRELSELYRAAPTADNADLPELPIQYSDFAAAQEEWLQSDSCRSQLAYWRDQLKGAPILQLPADHPRPASQSFRGGTCRHVFSKELMREVKQFAQREECTPFMVLLAVFKTLLFRYSGQTDLVVGCPIAGRTQLETENLIGFFVNTLALRTHLDPGLPFRELVRRVRETTLGAYAHQELPFDRVVEELHPHRSSNHMPLVQVVFALNNEYFESDHFPGLRVEEVETNTGTAKFDLTFVTKETNAGLSAVVEYNSDLFEAARMERMLGHFEQLLDDALSRPHEKIGSLELLTKAERALILNRWSTRVTEYPREESVTELFEMQVARTPENVAVKYGSTAMTYRELNARANQLAHYLQRQKIGPNSLVGVYMERSVDLVIALLAILKAGGAYVPLDLSYPADRLNLMIQDTQMSLIITDSNQAAALPQADIPLLLLDKSTSEIQREPRQRPPGRVSAGEPAYIIYTSGSTGRPKGVVVAHRGITRLVVNTDYVQIQEGDRIAQASNASFDAATFEIWGALLSGATLVGIPKTIALSPSDLAETLRAEGVTILFLTTALFNQLAREVPGAFAPLKTVLFGGEAVDPKWVRAVLESGAPRDLLHVYGPTENTTFSTWHRISTVAEEAVTVPIGQPIANSELYILDARLQPVPVGIPGEIFVGGDGLGLGYWNRPELTAEKFLPHPFRTESGARLYRTGDLGRFDDQGNVEFVGRLDHQIKLRGFRIELGEIEALLARHEQVANNVVMLREDSPGEKRIVAYVTAKGETPVAADLRAFLRQHLPDYMVPAAYVFLESFPLTPNEKVDRKLLPAPDQNRPALNKSFIAPRDSTEGQLAKIWEKVLGVQPIGVADNFFDLGGHSLLAVRVFSQIEKIFQKKLPLATLFRAPTIEEIATILREENQAKSWSTIVDIQPKGSKPPFYWIHTLGGDGGGGFFYYRKLAELLGPDQPSFGIRSPREPFTRIPDMARFYLREIRKFQPEGPYFLGGFCFGGNVAYEMAQQLAAAGEKVGLLVMLESSPPNVSHKQSWNATAAKYSIENLVENVKDFVNHSPKQRLTMLKNKSKRLRQKLRGKSGEAADENSTPQLKDVIDLSNYPEGYVTYAQTHWQALTDYQPQPYPGELMLFRARKQGLSNFNHTLGWDSLVDERVQVTVVPGTHESMLQEPNVQIVAAKIRHLLDTAGQRPG